jgi:5'-nucleotidase
MQTLYVDMDNVLVDFPSGIAKISDELREQFDGDLDDVPGIFALMDPLPGAIDSFNKLAQVFDTYILSTAPWNNPSAWKDKIEWVQKYLGRPAFKRLILSHNKHLNIGDYLIDDRLANGVEKFTGEHIHFGTERFPDWQSVCDYLLPST